MPLLSYCFFQYYIMAIMPQIFGTRPGVSTLFRTTLTSLCFGFLTVRILPQVIAHILELVSDRDVPWSGVGGFEHPTPYPP